VKVDGIKRIATKRVTLDEFFSEPTFVDIRIMGPYTRAKIREVMMSSFDVSNVDAVGKSAGVTTKTEGMADRDMKIRTMKLTECAVGHSIKSDGAGVAWGEELFKELDDADPRILGKVISEIDSFGEGDVSPT